MCHHSEELPSESDKEYLTTIPIWLLYRRSASCEPNKEELCNLSRGIGKPRRTPHLHHFYSWKPGNPAALLDMGTFWKLNCRGQDKLLLLTSRVLERYHKSKMPADYDPSKSQGKKKVWSRDSSPCLLYTLHKLTPPSNIYICLIKEYFFFF